MRSLGYSPLTPKENTEQTVLISPLEMSEVPRVASSMFPILLKKFLESVPQNSCSALHAMLWSARAAEMNCREFIYISRRRHAFTGRILPEVDSSGFHHGSDRLGRGSSCRSDVTSGSPEAGGFVLAGVMWHI